MTRIKTPKEGSVTALILKTFDERPTLRVDEIAGLCGANRKRVNEVLLRHDRRPAKRAVGRPPGPAGAGTIAERILKVFDLDPMLSSYRIATLVNAEPNYVRFVLKRHGRRLHRRRIRKDAELTVVSSA
jgi:hypothetical protein